MPMPDDAYNSFLAKAAIPGHNSGSRYVYTHIHFTAVTLSIWRWKLHNCIYVYFTAKKKSHLCKPQKKSMGGVLANMNL